MGPAGQQDQSDISQWPISRWNKQLVEGLLRRPAPSGSYEDLRHLVVTREAFASYVDRPSAEPTIADDFIECLRSHLKSTGRALDTDGARLAEERRWSPEDDSPPPFWSHLVFTCIVASAPEVSDEGQFRRRLATLLGTSATSTLNRLPRLWRDVAEWTRKQNARVGNCRQLILPDPGSKCLIGYSLGLAFPTFEDGRTLVSTLERARLLGDEPPLSPSILAIEKDLRIYSREFVREFQNFRSTLHRSSAYQTKFWSAVRDAALHGVRREVVRNRINILGTEDGDGQFFVWIVSDVKRNRSEWGTFESDFLDESEFLVYREQCDFEGAQSASHWLLNRFGCPWADARSLRAIEDGLIVFEEIGAGRYAARSSFPTREPFFVLLKSQISRQFQTIYPHDAESTDYNGWFLIRRNSLKALAEATTQLPEDLRNIRCLQLTSTPPKITVIGGFYCDSGTTEFLGFPALLPTIGVETATSVRVRPILTSKPEIAVQGNTGSWILSPSAPLHGEYIIEATDEGSPIARRSISFSTDYFGHDVRDVAKEEEWFFEGRTGELEGLPDAFEPVVSCRNDLANVEDWSISFDSEPLHQQSSEELERCDLMAIALLSKFTHKRGMDFIEFRDVVERVFGSQAKAASICRTWIESRRLRRLFSRHWRSTRLLPIPPHFCAYVNNEGVYAVTVGLWYPQLLAKLRHLCESNHVPTTRLNAADAWSPASFRLKAEDLGAIQFLQRILELGATTTLPPIRTVTLTAVEAFGMGNRPELVDRFNSNPISVIRLSQALEASDIASSIEIDRYEVRGGPDNFVVKDKVGANSFWTHSRVTAWLVASQLAGVLLFDLPGSESLLMRGYNVPLPAPIGLFASVFNFASPGQQDNNRRIYHFGSKRLRDEIGRALFPSFYSEPERDLPSYKFASVELRVLSLLSQASRHSSGCRVSVANLIDPDSIVCTPHLRTLINDSHVAPRFIPAIRQLLCQLTNDNGNY